MRKTLPHPLLFVRLHIAKSSGEIAVGGNNSSLKFWACEVGFGVYITGIQSEEGFEKYVLSSQTGKKPKSIVGQSAG
jgi:hypothetical protein